MSYAAYEVEEKLLELSARILKIFNAFEEEYKIQVSKVDLQRDSRDLLAVSCQSILAGSAYTVPAEDS